MTATSGEFDVLCNSIVLICHESRNVRHLVHDNLLSADPWRFVFSLPTNPDNAWHKIAPLRDKAPQTLSVDDALMVFERRFHRSLHDLAGVFENENCKNAKLYGGNAWATITNLTLQFADALRRKDAHAAQKIATKLKNARHNTGSVQEKIARLEKTLKQMGT